MPLARQSDPLGVAAAEQAVTTQIRDQGGFALPGGQPRPHQRLEHHIGRVARAANVTLVHCFSVRQQAFVIADAQSLADAKQIVTQRGVQFVEGRLLVRRDGRQLILERGYESFALIRDPYERLVSAFLDKFVCRIRVGPVTGPDQMAPFVTKAYRKIRRIKKGVDFTYEGLTFREFIHLCIEAIVKRNFGEPKLNNHWNTQVPFNFVADEFKYDHLYSLNESEQFFAILSDRFKTKITSRRQNAQPNEFFVPIRMHEKVAVIICQVDEVPRRPGYLGR